MSDLIDRQLAIEAVEFGITYAKAVNRETGEATELFKQSNEELKKAIERIQKLPPAEPKTGRWLDTYNDGDWHCSECGAIVEKDEQIRHNWQRCYHCGAKMEGEDNG